MAVMSSEATAAASPGGNRRGGIPAARRARRRSDNVAGAWEQTGYERYECMLHRDAKLRLIVSGPGPLGKEMSSALFGGSESRLWVSCWAQRK